MNLLKAGFGRTDITPPLGIGLAGYYVARQAETVLDPLTVSALALEAGGKRVLLISMDNLHANAKALDPIRREISRCTGVDFDGIFISATHIHTGPGYARAAESAVASLSDNRKLLESMLPEGRKYVESVSVTDNPEIMQGQEMLDT